MDSETALWIATFSQLPAQDLARVSATCRPLQAAVTSAAAKSLEELFAPGRVQLPDGMSPAEALHLGFECPQLLVVGGEDRADMPLLHLTLLTLSPDGKSHRGDLSRSGKSSCNGYRSGMSNDEKRLRSGLPPARVHGWCSLPSGRFHLAAAKVGPLICLTGGTGADGEPCRDVLLFNMLSRSWTGSRTLGAGPPPMPTPRYGHESVAVQGRYLVCIGGKAAGAKSPQVSDEIVGGSADVLDTITERWASLPCRLKNPRVYFGASVVGTYIIVAGGLALGSSEVSDPEESSMHRLRSTEVLDASDLNRLFEENPSPATSSSSLYWQTGPPLHSPRSHFSLAGPIEGILYAVGGNTNSTNYFDSTMESLDAGALTLACSALEAEVKLATPQTTNELSWQALHDVRTSPDSCTVALGRMLVKSGGNIRAVLYHRPTRDDKATSWQPLGVDLDILRYGAKVVAFGCPDGAELLADLGVA
eukprot:TRINITY_DN79987_c0_g1_i1.p1 TRINITY_DN79987_c0_g1~~TRINITY_DN79987_c0_g1_i1.p1  ORF type:complete len:476 (+),score=73.01 TRINITY_DN79987_c0_g1_i1:69-1496(+)